MKDVLEAMREARDKINVAGDSICVSKEELANIIADKVQDIIHRKEKEKWSQK